MANSVKKEWISHLNNVEIHIEEMLSLMSEDLTIGDEGVAEAIISIENHVKLADRIFSRRFPGI